MDSDVPIPLLSGDDPQTLHGDSSPPTPDDYDFVLISDDVAKLNLIAQSDHGDDSET